MCLHWSFELFFTFFLLTLQCWSIFTRQKTHFLSCSQQESSIFFYQCCFLMSQWHKESFRLVELKMNFIFTAMLESQERPEKQKDIPGVGVFVRKQAQWRSKYSFVHLINDAICSLYRNLTELRRKIIPVMSQQ